MGDYSREPPRRNCILHLSFDAVEGNRVVDTSPTATDGAISGDPQSVTGAIGSGLRFRGGDSVSSPLDIGGTEDITLSTWLSVGETEREVDNPLLADGSDAASLRLDATTSPPTVVGTVEPSGASSPTTVTAEASRDGWHHVALVRDVGEARLYVDGGLRDSASVDGQTFPTTSSYAIGGDGTAELTDSAVDEPRVYRTALTVDQVESLHEIGSELTAATAVRNSWENAGIPLRGANRQLGGALAEEKATIRRQLDFLREARHINDAAGEQLDDIGAIAGIARQEDESDDKYRARIKTTLIAARSSGRFTDILQTTAAIVEADTDRIELETQFDSDPGTAFVYVRTADVEDSVLTVTEIQELLNDAVLAGHRVEVIAQGATPFTVINDAQVNDPDHGLTSDAISTGGGLVSDI